MRKSAYDIIEIGYFVDGIRSILSEMFCEKTNVLKIFSYMPI